MQGQSLQGQVPSAKISWESFAFVDEEEEENEDDKVSAKRGSYLSTYPTYPSLSIHPSIHNENIIRRRMKIFFPEILLFMPFQNDNLYLFV